MARISDRSHNTLRQVDQRFIRLENTTVAGECLANAIASCRSTHFLHIIYAQAPFASVDGQKHGCRLQFQTRFSAKYFRRSSRRLCPDTGLQSCSAGRTGDSPMSMGHFAFDLLFNNASDIQPGCLATDTTASTALTLRCSMPFGYQFTPRYKISARRSKTSLNGSMALN